MNDPRFEVRDTPGKGRGLFTRVPLARGDRVLALEGTLFTTAQLTDDLLALQVDHDLWLCSPGTSTDDFINHSCDPNTGFTHGDTVLFALRDIAEGEEVTWDYSTSISEAGWSLDCGCGSPRCRGIVKPWGELDPADRNRLRTLALAYLRSWL